MDKLTIGRILREMRPGQLWTTAAAIVALASGAFLLGYKLQLSTADLRADRTEAKLAEFRGLQTKERFLAFYLRYLIAKERLAAESNEENRGAVEKARDAYREYAMELLKRGEEAEDEIDLRGAVIGKSGGEDVSVKFGYDGSVWPLPRELGLAASAD